MTMTLVTLVGCDDTTAVWVRTLTDGQREFLEALAATTQQAGGGCSPTMTLEEWSDDEYDKLDEWDRQPVVEL